MNVFLGLAVISECLDFRPEIVIVCDHSARFTVCAKILSRVETKATDISYGPCSPALVLCAVCLTRILDHVEAISTGDVDNWIHVRHLSKQVHGDNGPGFGSDR